VPQDPPAATLPEIRKVTLKTDEMKPLEFVAAFARASRFPIEYSLYYSKGDWDSEPVAPMTVDFDGLPFAEAIARADLASDDMGFEAASREACFRLKFRKNRDLHSFHGLFGFRVGDVRETLRSDFSSEQREAALSINAWWQPDLHVFRRVAVRIESCRDDLGTDLRCESKPLFETEDSFSVPILLAPARATKIARLKGELLVEVPGRCEEVGITDLARAEASLRAANCDITIARKNEENGPRWTITVKGDGVLALVEPRLDREDGGVALDRGWPNVKAGVLSIANDLASPATALRFKIVRSKTTIAVPFDFKDIPLPRQP
jgi:hypothetical protein